MQQARATGACNRRAVNVYQHRGYRMMFGLGFFEIAAIAVVALIFIRPAAVILLFGATALPKLARSIGKAKREFQ